MESDTAFYWAEELRRLANRITRQAKPRLWVVDEPLVWPTPSSADEATTSMPPLTVTWDDLEKWQGDHQEDHLAVARSTHSSAAEPQESSPPCQCSMLSWSPLCKRHGWLALMGRIQALEAANR